MKVINKFSGNVTKVTQWRVKDDDNNLCLLNKARLVSKVLQVPAERLIVEFDTRRLRVKDSMTETHANDTDFILKDSDGNIFVADVAYMNDNYMFVGR